MQYGFSKTNSRKISSKKQNRLLEMDDHPIQLIPLIPADRFRSHAEDNAEYADLYCHVEQRLQLNYDWAVSHPEEVNNKNKTARPTYHCRFAPGSGPHHGQTDQRTAAGNLCSPNGRIAIGQLNLFKVRVVKKVAEKLKQAGYKVTYVVEEDRTRHNKEVSEIELDDKLVVMYISLQ